MQIIPWQTSSGTVDQLVRGETRTITITLTPSAASSATVSVVQRATNTVLVSGAAATIAGYNVSYSLVVPDIVGTIDIVFFCAIGSEVVGFAVRAEVVPQ